MRKLTVSPILKSLVAVAIFLCSIGPVAAQEKPRVVAVNYPLQYFADRLLGDSADVIFPVPADVDPSYWRPSIADISMIQSADLILLNGAGFATWVDRVSLPRTRLVNTSMALKDRFIVTESITHSHGDGGEHAHEGLASYLWLDPMLALAQAEAIATAVVARNLAPEAEVADRLAALKSDLERLDAKARTALSGAQDVAIIATHPRYQYFARRYALSITTLEWEAGAMPTFAELAELERRAGETEARILIWEAAPPEEALVAAQSLGLHSVIFPPLAQEEPDIAFDAALDRAITAISNAVSQISGG
ncbi:hypothetical protein So717_20940 [Roseobacter cerasinus]|uniref:Zinc transport system substrate-binding protein n=1 Tax=Roseobacter cerasinus TaxID=2602289 RepID=A0A640VTC9_9RHOB|nr:metal ABC transporter substrate-binding protein [Roseobacter cerasinus]GFE50341.1 hypothetical protein So717_20940 [Roseobacter cerasinus]